MGALQQELEKVSGQLRPKQENLYQVDYHPTDDPTQTGKIRMMAHGRALCICSGTKRNILIPTNQLSGAMQGDKVQVRIKHISNRKSRGQVVKILERAHPKLVGQVIFSGGEPFAIPVSRMIPNRIKLLDTIEVQAGHYVWVEVLNSSENGEPFGLVREIMGTPSTPHIDEKLITYEEQLPYRFSQKALDEGDQIPAFILDTEIEKRVDLRTETIFTIDGQSSKDFDDAVSIKLLGNGNCLLGVHIADVGHYVKVGSYLDKEARERGMSVYFADQTVIPMLPARLSENICSLVPHQDRLTLSCTIEFDHAGTPVKTDIFSSVIHSQARLTYTQVDEIIAGEEKDEAIGNQQIYRDLEIMVQLAKTLRTRRLVEGSLDLNITQADIIFDDNGDVVDFLETTLGPSHQIIEEFMLATNRAVASYLRDFPCIYRAQDAPPNRDVQNLRQFLETRGYVWCSEEEISTKILNSILSQARAKEEEPIIKRVLFSICTRAYYSSEPKGHFNLAFDRYTHFTSPIRRYVDLYIHRLVKAAIEDDIDQIICMDDRLESIAAEITRLEERTKSAERMFCHWKQAEFISSMADQDFKGYISNTTNYGLFVTFSDLPITGLIHKSTFKDDRYVYNESSKSWKGISSRREFAIGQNMNLQAKVDKPKQLSLSLAA